MTVIKATIQPNTIKNLKYIISYLKVLTPMQAYASIDKWDEPALYGDDSFLFEACKLCSIDLNKIKVTFDTDKLSNGKISPITISYQMPKSDTEKFRELIYILTNGYIPNPGYSLRGRYECINITEGENDTQIKLLETLNIKNMNRKRGIPGWLQ